jgi:hypothetical protein
MVLGLGDHPSRPITYITRTYMLHYSALDCCKAQFKICQTYYWCWNNIYQITVQYLTLTPPVKRRSSTHPSQSVVGLKCYSNTNSNTILTTELLYLCETMIWGEPAQPSRGDLSHIYNGCVTIGIIHVHVYRSYT